MCSRDQRSSEQPILASVVGVADGEEGGVEIHGTSEMSLYCAFAKGTQATVVCTGNGRVMGDPQLEDCAFAR
jgi:hypothetical protein